MESIVKIKLENNSIIQYFDTKYVKKKLKKKNENRHLIFNFV